MKLKRHVGEHRIKKKGNFLKRAVGLIVAATFFSVPGADVLGSFLTQPAPVILTHTGPTDPVSLSPVLSWTPESDAVAYEIEFFTEYVDGLSLSESDGRAIWRTTEIYENFANIPIDKIIGKSPGKAPVWWRVRALDLYHEAISPFSGLAALYTNPDLPRTSSPTPHDLPEPGRGAALLYPVYSWVKPYGISNFEVQIFNDNPEIFPSEIPVETLFSNIAEIYDESPRMGGYPIYWRVRSLNDVGAPVSEWSSPARRDTPEAVRWEAAVFGDSISHGGGHLSFGPEHLEYSWLHYLEFPTINLSQSGNVTADMVERFERDVLPFSPKYLLIMGGSNDLRGGDYTVEDAIENMETIKEKCLENGIYPIFLTIPPINPENIRRSFNEDTVPDWKERFDQFNEYIRQQPHIDTAAAIEAYSEDGKLPEWLGMDGLHEDVIGKQLMAARINAEWDNIKLSAEDNRREKIL